MVSTHRKKRSNTRVLSQLDDFDQDVIIGTPMNNRQENTAIKEGISHQEFTVANSDGGQTAHENVVYVKTLESCFNERIDKEMGNIINE